MRFKYIVVDARGETRAAFQNEAQAKAWADTVAKASAVVRPNGARGGIDYTVLTGPRYLQRVHIGLWDEQGRRVLEVAMQSQPVEA